MPRKLATIRDKYGLRFQIVGIRNHVKLPVIVGLQPSDLEIYRTDVKKLIKFVVGIVVPAFIMAGGMASSAVTQQKTLKEQIVGTWDAVSVITERADGTKFHPMGEKLKGLSIYTRDGHFSQHNTRTNVPKFASGNRMQGTADENRTAAQGSYALFGTYTVNEADKTMTLRIAASSFPNEIGTEQIRALTFSGDELRYVNPNPPSGGSAAVNVLRRAM